jgi:hypothetical protein
MPPAYRRFMISLERYENPTAAGHYDRLSARVLFV